MQLGMAVLQAAHPGRTEAQVTHLSRLNLDRAGGIQAGLD